MNNLPESLVDTNGVEHLPRVWVRLNEFGGWSVMREGHCTGYGSVDKGNALETARDYARRNNCRVVDDPLGTFSCPLPMFEAYVDGLAKKGIIDGNIAECLLAYHRQEVADPRAPLREALKPILDEMFHYATYAVTGDEEKRIVRGYAERIDDTLE